MTFLYVTNAFIILLLYFSNSNMRKYDISQSVRLPAMQISGAGLLLAAVFPSRYTPWFYRDCYLKSWDLNGLIGTVNDSTLLITTLQVPSRRARYPLILRNAERKVCSFSS
jgi:hypothetical protein